LEIAATLIKFNTQVNAIDKWGFSPLHESAQKGRTQLCALLLAHGANPFLKNQENQTAYDLATAEDVKSLLHDAMLANQPLNMSSSTCLPLKQAEAVELITLPSGNQIELPITMSCSTRTCLSVIDGVESNVDGAEEEKNKPSEYTDVASFLSKLKLDHLNELFEREQITLEILAEMGHDDLKAVGINAYGYRHKILKGITAMRSIQGFSFNTAPATILIDLLPSDKEYIMVEDEMQSTIRKHQRDINMGGIFNRYNIVRIQKLQNFKLWKRYIHRRAEIADENNGQYNEKMLFHGSPFINAIIQKGFDERHACLLGFFGAGIYFAENSSKSNQYVYGINGSGCHAHQNKSCYQCHRSLLLCRVALGNSFSQFTSLKVPHSPPGHHSIVGRPSLVAGGLHFAEYVIYRGEQAYPQYLIQYQIAYDKPDEESNDECS
jgi:tankyrase